MDLPEKVILSIRRNRLLEKGDRILVACSGGADSTCLLLVLSALQKAWDWELAVAHFNHRLRREADADERFVGELAAELGLTFHHGAGDVAASARRQKLNLEEAGRKLRYAFLEKTADASGADKIATGHTLDDQAETLLMRLFRGSGRSGLSGIPWKRGDRIVRPLLAVGRTEVEAFLRGRGRPFRIDRSNLDRRYLRNRIRWELLPLLKERFDPHIVSRLGRLADILQAEEEWIESQIESDAGEIIHPAAGSWRLDTEKLKSRPLAAQRRLVRLFLRRLRGDLRQISYTDIETILSLEEGRSFTLERGRILMRQGPDLLLKPETTPRLTYSYSWDGRSPLFLAEPDIYLTGRFLPRPLRSALKQDDRRTAVLDRQQLCFPLTVRSRKQGDRYRPLGAPGRQRLKEIFRSRGIPPAQRDRHPVLVAGGEIVWVVGLPVAEAYRVKEDTARIFQIEVAQGR